MFVPYIEGPRGPEDGKQKTEDRTKNAERKDGSRVCESKVAHPRDLRPQSGATRGE